MSGTAGSPEITPMFRVHEGRMHLQALAFAMKAEENSGAAPERLTMIRATAGKVPRPRESGRDVDLRRR